MERLSQPTPKSDILGQENAPAGMRLLYTLRGHTDLVRSLAWSPDGKILASGSSDQTVRLWDLKSGSLLRSLEGRANSVLSVAWSISGKRIATGSVNQYVRLWDLESGSLLDTLGSHTGIALSIAWSPDGKILASGSDDKTIRLWDPEKRRLLHVFEGHTGAVLSIAWSPDGKILASSSSDKTIRLWDPEKRRLLHVFEGHTGAVLSIAWSPDEKILASSSSDKTIRLWDLTVGRLLHTLEGYTNMVRSVAWSPNGQLLAAHSNDGPSSLNAEVSIWRTDTWDPLTMLTDSQGVIPSSWHPVHSAHPMLATVGEQGHEISLWQLDLEHLLRAVAFPTIVHYTNAKVVLVGDSGVGKSGLGLVLSQQPFTSTSSTHGRRVWNFNSQEVSLDEIRRETRETLLWDLAGQPGYRLIHQLHLDEVAAALVVFDAHSETDPFAGVQHWDRALRLAQRIQGSSALPLKKFLVAARIDRGGIGVSSERIETAVRELGFDGYFATSAKEGWRIDELREAICGAIDWQTLPKVTSTVLFWQIKQFLLDEKQQARQLISSVKDLYRTYLYSKDVILEPPGLLAQFETCVGRIESMGLIKRLSFGNLVLLQPELLDAYASALVNVVKDEPDGLGSIAEEQVRAGDFHIPSDERIQDKEQEKLLLIAMIEDLLRRELALREEGMLVFPSQSTKENPDLPDPEGKTVVFRFEGPVLNIYATLAVRLARSSVFKKKELWKNAVTYTTSMGGTCGIYLYNSGEGRGELTLFFDQSASHEARRVFSDYIHQYLSRQALLDGFTVRHVLTCNRCHTDIPDYMVQLRKKWKPKAKWVSCNVCDARVSLIKYEQRHIGTPSPHTQVMDQAADKQREREADQLTLQGRIAISDFDVFLCHNTIDKPTVKQIGRQLKEQGVLPWLDEWELPPGLPWQQALERQIERIKTVAVFVGKDGIGPWQYQELDAFLREFVQRGCPVIPVLLPDAPTDKPALPVFLRGMTWVDFRLADPDPMQRLLWGITGRREIGNERFGK